MKPLFLKFLARAGDLAQVEPLLTLFLGSALLALFLNTLACQRSRSADDVNPPPTLAWMIYHQFRSLLWAVVLAGFAIGAVALLRGYLHHTVGNFQQTHGRITEANYKAVQTIWGAEQVQSDLRLEIFYDEEVTERIESEDLTKPAVLRKKTVRHFVPGNPFVSARHEVVLRQNPRKKGSALYGGYETACRFIWRLKNPDDRELKCNLKFPLPAAGAMYDALIATLNGADILPQMELKEAVLTLARDLKTSETFELAIAFKSRGMNTWYFQVKEPREIRDFTLVLTLPDLPKTKLNYPEGCMSPTEIKTSPGQGSVLAYRLDHAISNKGMGIALPKLPQPGAATNAVLEEVERGWMLIFSMLLFTLTLAAMSHAVLVTVLFASATAFGWGLLADFSDLLFGFWTTACLIWLPMFVLLAWLLKRTLPSEAGKYAALLQLLFGIAYPTVAGLDADRQTLYLNLCALALLSFVAWQLVGKWRLQREAKT